MNAKKAIEILFLFLPFFLFAQLAYGLIVREPYPSFIMPGFSRVENNESTYELFERRFIVSYENGETALVELNDISQNFSKIALSYAVDLAFFNENYEGVYNSHQKKYYNIVKELLGEDFYEKRIIEVRNPCMNETEINEFSGWLKDSFSKELKQEVVFIKIERVKSLKELKTGKPIEEVILDEVII